MAEDTLTTSGIGRHGATRLPSVEVDSFNVELKDDEGFLGDRASKGAFRKILDGLRKPLKKNGDDPLGGKAAEKITKSELDAALLGADVGAAALVHGAIAEKAVVVLELDIEAVDVDRRQPRRTVPADAGGR